MKKKWISVLTALLMTSLITGCGNSSSEGEALYKVAVEKLITIPDYKNLDIALDGDPVKVDEDELESLMLDVYKSGITEYNGGITNRAVADGDTVVIDYEGKKDGVAFSGGTAKGADLTIGSHSFIDGFEEGLIGVMPGETVDLNLTFPTDYRSEELRGQAVVFTVTVHYILPDDISLSNMNPQVIKDLGIEGVETVEQLKLHVATYLADNSQTDRTQEYKNTICDALVKQTEFKKLPKKMLDSYKNKLLKGVETAAASYGMDADSYSNYFYSKSAAELVDSLAETTMKQELIMQAIANAENLNVSDEELQTQLEELAVNNGYESVDQFLEEQSAEDYRNYLMTGRVMDFLIDQYLPEE